MRRALLLLVALLLAPAAAGAQTFSANFETCNGGVYNFSAIATPDLPTGSSITCLTNGGWKGTGGAQITINGCGGGTCSTGLNQGNAGWFTGPIGGTYSIGASRYIGFRIKILSSVGDAAGKFVLFGSPPGERFNLRFDKVTGSGAGCQPSGEPSGDFYGVDTPDTDPANAWQRATEFGLGGTFASLLSGGQSNYVTLISGINVSINCAAFAVLPNASAVPDIKPQQNAAISQSGWVHYQVGITSGTAGNVSIKTWVNNNTFASPTSQCVNCAIGGGNALGVGGWEGGITFGGFWGQASLSPVIFVVDDFFVSPTFNSSFYEVAGDAAPTVTSITPNTGSIAGGTAVTIGGTGFVSGATATIGGTPCTGVSFGSAASLTCTTPAGTVGAKDVVVTNPDAQTGTLTGGYIYAAAASGVHRPFRNAFAVDPFRAAVAP